MFLELSTSQRDKIWIYEIRDFSFVIPSDVPMDYEWDLSVTEVHLTGRYKSNLFLASASHSGLFRYHADIFWRSDVSYRSPIVPFWV